MNSRAKRSREAGARKRPAGRVVIFGIDEKSDARCFVSVAQGPGGELTAECANEGCDGECRPYMRWGTIKGEDGAEKRIPIFGCQCLELV